MREQGKKVLAPERQIATIDHSIPTDPTRSKYADELNRKQVEQLRTNCKEFGIRLLDVGSGQQGVVHVAVPELGLTRPGMTIVCGDSHTATHGAFGALAFGIGTTQISHVLATSALLMDKPKTMRVNFVGTPSKYFTAKDAILALIRQIGVQGGNGHVIEYTGQYIRDLSMEERMTICNMSIECGARAGLIAPDEVTEKWLANTDVGANPCGRPLCKGNHKGLPLQSDPDATFDTEITVDLTDKKPLTTWGTTPDQSAGIDECVPEATDLATTQALAYTKLKPGQAITDIKIEQVFVGSCTNGRLSDLQVVADILKDKKIADSVVMRIVPGSELVKKQAEALGLDKIFIQAGADWRQPGCSSCLAMNGDVVPAGEHCASTSNRNFVGRQGPGAITHLVSPLMAAVAALTGKITDPEDVL